MKPYSQIEAAANPIYRNYNKILSGERILRITIEHVFGQLKSRFQMLRVPYPIRVDIEMVPKFIISCAILHNVGKYIDDNWEDDKTDDKGDSDEFDDPDTPSQVLRQPVGTVATRAAGQARREGIASAILNYAPNCSSSSS